jgi:hypothetical protein
MEWFRRMNLYERAASRGRGNKSNESILGTIKLCRPFFFFFLSSCSLQASPRKRKNRIHSCKIGRGSATSA